MGSRPLKLSNPVIVAASPYSMAWNRKNLDGLDYTQVGALVTKSVTMYDRPEYYGQNQFAVYEKYNLHVDGKYNVPTGMSNNNPISWSHRKYFYNNIRLANVGADKLAEILTERDKPVLIDVPIIVSLAGTNPSEFRYMIQLFDTLERDICGYEINLSCPNDYDAMIGYDTTLVGDIIDTIHDTTDRSTFVKVGAGMDMAVDTAVEHGISGITVINALPINIARNICGTKNPASGLPRLSGMPQHITTGAISGDIIRPYAIARVERYRAMYPDLPIIGCGGIMRPRHIDEYYTAGANMFQVGSAILVNDYSLSLLRRLSLYARWRMSWES